MAKNECLIEVKDLWHVYPGGVEALKGVSLKIQEGELTAIIGQNGSGKTTLVKHFNGLLKPTKGRVLVKGVDTKNYDPKKLVSIVGYVFQNPTHQLFCTTIEEEIAFGPRNLGISEEEVKERVEEMLKTFRLEEYRGEHPYRLSFPLRKMLTIASVYAMRPEVLVLDEPTTAQDHIGVTLIKRTVEELNARGHTIVIITHDMSLVAEVSKRAVVLFEGKIIADDTPKKVFTNHKAMEETKLIPPQITRLAQLFRDPRIPDDILTVDEMHSTLKTLK